MILDHDGESFHGRIERGPFGHRPRFQDAVDLEPEVVVKVGGMVLLHDEGAARLAHSPARRRLGRRGEIAPPAILSERPCSPHADRGHHAPAREKPFPCLFFSISFALLRRCRAVERLPPFA
jgi:hypothetical protein